MAKTTTGASNQTERPASQFFGTLADGLSRESLLQRHVPLASLTTLRVGGPADFYAEPASEADLAHLLRTCNLYLIPFLLIGRGSNLLIKDHGYRGLVIRLNHKNFIQIEVEGERITAGAGAKMKTVANHAKRHDLAGLEFLEGIPGTIGGGLRMNAGAMAAALFDRVETVRYMERDGTIKEQPAANLSVAYRDCPFFATHVALSAVLRGRRAKREDIEKKMGEFSQKRWKSQPAAPSAGCIFKNSITCPAGRLIDELGLKGTRVGGAVVSEVHGNFIVTGPNSTAQDVLDLIALIREKARTVRGIDLETEVQIVGE